MIDARREIRYREVEARLWASLGAEPVERPVHLARLGREVRVQELGDGPPVVFIHGATTCGTSWASLATLLPEFRCLLVDRPGTGLSEPLRPPIRDAAGLAAVAEAFVPDLLDGLGLETVDLVATSFGGYFAWRGALAAPDRVARIVELGWTAGAPTGRLPLAMRIGATQSLGRLLARMPVTRASVRQLFRGIGLREAVEGGRVSDEAVDAYAGLLRWTDTMRNDLDVGSLVLAPWSGTDRGLLLSRAERASIRVPVLFAWSERDPFGGEAVARAFVRPFPNARLELLPGAGHAPWMDDAAAAARLVADFLAESREPVGRTASDQESIPEPGVA